MLRNDVARAESRNSFDQKIISSFFIGGNEVGRGGELKLVYGERHCRKNQVCPGNVFSFFFFFHFICEKKKFPGLTRINGRNRRFDECYENSGEGKRREGRRRRIFPAVRRNKWSRTKMMMGRWLTDATTIVQELTILVPATKKQKNPTLNNLKGRQFEGTIVIYHN